MKKETIAKRASISNDLMHYIYKHIDTDINLDELAETFKISKYHMHKIFKEVFGRNIYETIKSIRLQKASSLLLSNRSSTISTISLACGYSSQTSFIRAFKKRFSMTPKVWRKGGDKKYSQNLLISSPNASHSTASFDNISPTYVKMSKIHAYYIRHTAYEENIRSTWQKLHVWLLSSGIEKYTLMSLFHDNPAVTPLVECQHVACVITEEEIDIKEGTVLPQLYISEGVYAKFDLQGKRGDILKFINWIYHEWLPNSEYSTTIRPPYAIYKKHHHLSEDEHFDLSFYLPIVF